MLAIFIIIFDSTLVINSAINFFLVVVEFISILLLRLSGCHKLMNEE